MTKFMLIVVYLEGITFRELKNMEEVNHLSEHGVRAFLDMLVGEGSVEIKNGIIREIPYARPEEKKGIEP